MLQKHGYIRAYVRPSANAVDHDPAVKDIKVTRREKPEDYFYTETPGLSYEELAKRVTDLEGEGIANAVADYLKKNPIESGATVEEATQIQQNKTDIEKLAQDKLDADKLPEAVNEALAQAQASGAFKGEQGEPGPAGPAGADGQPGEKGDPGYTPVKGVDYFDGKDGNPGADGKTPIKGTDYFTDADKQELAEQAADLVEVPVGGGFVARDTPPEDTSVLWVDINDNEGDVPEATMKPLTFTGAVNATYDGSEAVSVEIPTGGGGSGGGSANWNLLRSVTLAEDTKYITQSLDGNYDEIRILFNNLWCVEGKSAQLAIAVNNGNTGISAMCAVGGSFVNAPAYPSEGAILISKMSDSISSCTIIGQNTSGNKNGCGTFALVNNVADGISKVMFSLNVYSQNTMNAGAVIDIYGR
jgi:hypothetical protein